ncbi:MAG: hypothetical protein ACXU9U_05020 [Parachlamydiaceae bacterium]
MPLFFLLKKHLFDSWWVFFFALLCFICYEQEVKAWKAQYKILSLRLGELQNERKIALRLKTELKEQIQSQNDPEWIELVLMNKLGLVPEGQKKVIFTE